MVSSTSQTEIWFKQWSDFQDLPGEKRGMLSPSVWKSFKLDFVTFMSSSQRLGWKLDCFENLGSSGRVFHCSQNYICLLHFGTRQHTEHYKKYLRILPVLPFIQRLLFCIWNARRQGNILAGQSLLLPQQTKFSYILFFPTRTTQIEDNGPLNSSSTKWEHSAALYYAAIDLNIYTFCFSLHYHYRTNIWSSVLIRDTHISTGFIDLTYISGTTWYLVRFIFG